MAFKQCLMLRFYQQSGGFRQKGGGSRLWGTGSVIRDSGSQIRGAASEIRRDLPPPNLTPAICQSSTIVDSLLGYPDVPDIAFITHRLMSSRYSDAVFTGILVILLSAIFVLFARRICVSTRYRSVEMKSLRFIVWQLISYEYYTWMLCWCCVRADGPQLRRYWRYELHWLVSKTFSVQLPTYADNVALPAFARLTPLSTGRPCNKIHRYLLPAEPSAANLDISCPPSP